MPQRPSDLSVQAFRASMSCAGFSAGAGSPERALRDRYDGPRAQTLEIQFFVRLRYSRSERRGPLMEPADDSATVDWVGGTEPSAPPDRLRTARRDSLSYEDYSIQLTGVNFNSDFLSRLYPAKTLSVNSLSDFNDWTPKAEETWRDSCLTDFAQRKQTVLSPQPYGRVISPSEAVPKRRRKSWSNPSPPAGPSDRSRCNSA
jgi:hypothetical protein